jgi:beta-glucosidase/6-phospho-beta-glucosidase/beta-galactosidase
LVDWFGDYARMMFEALGVRVSTWITFNEPFIDVFVIGGAIRSALDPEIDPVED